MSIPEFTYHLPFEKFVYRDSNGRWDLDHPCTKTALEQHLRNLGWSLDRVRLTLNGNTYPVTYGHEVFPGCPDLFAQEGRTYVNTWVPSKIVPLPTDYPTIVRILEFLTAGDGPNRQWLEHWLANKVQHPTTVPQVSVALITKPGAGKDFLYRILAEILGPENCAMIQRGELEGRFNARWAEKLVVYANEISSGDNQKPISERLKVLITARDVEFERKGIDQITVKNKAAWLFASNDQITPLKIDRSDRRYTVFANNAEVPVDYAKALKKAFKEDRTSFHPHFLVEIAGFAHHLLNLPVDYDLIQTPHHNAERELLMDSNTPSSEAFIDHVNKHGITDLLDEVLSKDFFSGHKSRDEWDFGDKGLKADVVYKCYRAWCAANGRQPYNNSRFGVAATKAGWSVKNLGPKFLHGYKVKR